ncbi:MAG: hypothetical protein JSV55_09395 [Deltaproteobacteria bacterium]|nr:MAG: hypothetical protein JSV40_10420 [Deltaproteobacteria bacterium]UCH06331.1 MAG: hypothetical protein JSV55_09395 [Deltaproteobacteria bacterium]
MTRKIEVRTIGSEEIREVTIQEAEKILEDTYNDPVGGLVADARTGEVIYKIKPGVEKIIIMEQMLGGG